MDTAFTNVRVAESTRKKIRMLAAMMDTKTMGSAIDAAVTSEIARLETAKNKAQLPVE